MTDELKPDTTETPGRITIVPMAGWSEAEALNGYYKDRTLVLANEVYSLQAALKQAEKDKEEVEKKHKEEIARLNKDRDQLMADLQKAGAASVPAPVASTAPIATPKMNKVK
ncbi:hypothetical protein ABE527_08465 [Brucella sp. TWI432]